MATSTNTIVLTTANKEANIILDWNDGEWYISDIQSTSSSSGTTTATSNSANASQGSSVKLAAWDTTYKYAQYDIVAYKGDLYVSAQNVNQGYIPGKDTFWWRHLIDLTAVDAITVEGKNVSEIMKEVLGGNVITDYYKKTEIDNIILTYFNSVNAKKLNDWTLKNIQDYVETEMALTLANAKTYTANYMADGGQSGLDQTLVDLFDVLIAKDSVNK